MRRFCPPDDRVFKGFRKKGAAQTAAQTALRTVGELARWIWRNANRAGGAQAYLLREAIEPLRLSGASRFALRFPAPRLPDLCVGAAPDAPRRHASRFVFSLCVRPLGRCSDCLVRSRAGDAERARRRTAPASQALHDTGWAETPSAALPGSRRNLPGRCEEVPLPPLS